MTKRSVHCDPKIAAALDLRIDCCEFAAVKWYAREPDTDINQVVVVHPSYRLEDVGSVAVSGDRQCWAQLMARGAIVYAVDQLPDGAPTAVLLDNYPDKRHCEVLYLPPAYLVQFLAPIESDGMSLLLRTDKLRHCG